MMQITLHIQEGLSNLLASKLRSFLAILGILVGTASVVAMISSGNLATQAALKQFKQLGTNLMSISLFEQNHDAKKSANTIKKFDLQAALNLQTASPDISLVAPYVSLYEPVSFKGHMINNATIVAATDNMQAAIKISLARGRFISFLDRSNYYAVIGHDLYQHLQGYTQDAIIGQQIYLGQHIFTIIGVANAWRENTFFNADINQALIIPISTASSLSKYAAIHNMVLRLRKKFNIDEVTNAIHRYFKRVAPNQQLYLRSAKQIIESMKNQRHIFTIYLGLIGGISLLVGGIGVMNIMLVSVVERKREIGIRMAVGARRKDIRLLFLIEALSLSLFGGIMGVLLGILTSYIIAHFAQWDFMIFFTPALIGFLVSVATGIFFGFYPAYKASQLDPIDALRSE